jgi:hypothetical protein
LSRAPFSSEDCSGPRSATPLELSAEQRMLLDIRDTLYEGNWDDFVCDLEARLHGQPHVFDLVPETPGFAVTIRHHLRLIDELRAWEQAHRTTLHSRPDV